MNELCMSYGEVLLAILSSESSKYYSINEMQYFLADRGINITENVIFNILRELEQRGKVERTARNHFRLSQVEQLEQITNKTGLHIAPRFLKELSRRGVLRKLGTAPITGKRN